VRCTSQKAAWGANLLGRLAIWDPPLLFPESAAGPASCEKSAHSFENRSE
jgi:hypothetical protein